MAIVSTLAARARASSVVVPGSSKLAGWMTSTLPPSFSSVSL